MPANSSAAERVDFRLSFAFLFLPMFTCRRTRRFQVTRVFEAIAGRFLAREGANVKQVLVAWPISAAPR
jgi:hypothetical protein